MIVVVVVDDSLKKDQPQISGPASILPSRENVKIQPVVCSKLHGSRSEANSHHDQHQSRRGTSSFFSTKLFPHTDYIHNCN